MCVSVSAQNGKRSIDVGIHASRFFPVLTRDEVMNSFHEENLDISFEGAAHRVVVTLKIVQGMLNLKVRCVPM